MGNLIVLGVIALILLAATIKVVTAMKSGTKCMGCPHAKPSNKKNKNKNDCNCGH